MPLTLRGKISNITPLTLDETLTLEGASADAKAVGEAIKGAEERMNTALVEHKENIKNPHKVTAEQIGLGNCNNTADFDKPVSTAQAAAIADAKNAGLEAQEAAENALLAAEQRMNPDGSIAMTGDLKMGDNRIVNMADPEENTDGANKKYVDSRHFFLEVVLYANSWATTTDTAPYTQTVAVADILASDKPHYSVVYSDVHDIRLAEKAAFALVDDLDTADGSVIFTCFEEKPATDLTIQMEVNR